MLWCQAVRLRQTESASSAPWAPLVSCPAARSARRARPARRNALGSPSAHSAPSTQVQSGARRRMHPLHLYRTYPGHSAGSVVQRLPCRHHHAPRQREHVCRMHRRFIDLMPCGAMARSVKNAPRAGIPLWKCGGQSGVSETTTPESGHRDGSLLTCTTPLLTFTVRCSTSYLRPGTFTCKHMSVLLFLGYW